VEADVAGQPKDPAERGVRLEVEEGTSPGDYRNENPRRTGGFHSQMEREKGFEVCLMVNDD